MASDLPDRSGVVLWCRFLAEATMIPLQPTGANVARLGRIPARHVADHSCARA
ncbi:MAG: hypothetical protein HQL98_16010 [Magnetococcales bacterium]|nr:hypothetical protein [Magnetococcales bacterium]